MSKKSVVIPKISIPTVEELESLSSDDYTNLRKTNTFTRLRGQEGAAAANSSTNNIVEGYDATASSSGNKAKDDGDDNEISAASSSSSSSTKRKLRRDEEENDEVLETAEGDFGGENQRRNNNSNPEPRPTGSTIIVSARQRGNPLLRFLRNVPYEFGETASDYVLGESCCGLFLSLKFHKLHPDYVHERLKRIGRSFALQILLVQVDIPQPSQTLREINTICFNADWTLMLAWSPEEAAELLESYKIYQNKPPDFLMGGGRQQQHKSAQETTTTVDDEARGRLIDLLTTIRSITRTDAVNLIDTFGSLKMMVDANEERLALCPGLGLKKAKRLYRAFGAAWREETGTGTGTGVGTSDTCGEEATTSAASSKNYRVEEEEIDPDDDLFDAE